MDIGSLLLALALILLVAAFVARPIVEGRLRHESAEASPLDSLITQREAVLTDLRELDFDHTTGKLSEDDFTVQRGRLLAKGAEILQALDVASTLGPHKSEMVDDEIERLVTERRKGGHSPRTAQAKAAESQFCPQCGKTVRNADKYCASCGAKV